MTQKIKDMISFFRRIRLKLLSEGKTVKPALPVGRYFKYAIGEIVLVVIGILIDVQLITGMKIERN